MAIEFEYSLSQLKGNYVRSFVGVIIFLIPLFFVHGMTISFWIFLSVSCLFLLFILRTILRNLTKITITDDLIRVTNIFDSTLYWSQITEFSLSYFSTWRSGKNGWMQMKLRSPSDTITIESSLIGFKEIVSVALKCANTNNLKLTVATIANLEFIGLIKNNDG